MAAARGRFALLWEQANRTVTELHAKPSRILQAWLCLLAAVLLLAPFAGAAWSAHAAACCTADHCPIPEHHHSKAPVHGVDCEHEMAGMTDCSMRCCQSSDHPLVAPLTFVLPVVAALARPDGPIAATPVLRLNGLPRSSEVLSPPPRFSRFSL
jgi:hypothetical protein